MVFVGTPYGQNPQILVTDGIGGCGSRSKLSSQPLATLAAALRASRTVSRTSG
jgi:hypothetical protein